MIVLLVAITVAIDSLWLQSVPIPGTCCEFYRRPVVQLDMHINICQDQF